MRLDTSKYNKIFCSLTKHMDRTFQQIYIEDNKTLYNKYICAWSERTNLLIKRETGNKNWNTYGRSFVYFETDTESDEISVTCFSTTCCTEQTDIPYRTAEHYSYVNTAAVTSDLNPHCTLVTLHMTIGSGAIPGIPFCDESSLVLSHLILYTVQGPTAAHYPHVAHEP